MNNKNHKMSANEITQLLAAKLSKMNQEDPFNTDENIFEIVSWLNDRKISEAMLRLQLKNKIEEYGGSRYCETIKKSYTRDSNMRIIGKMPFRDPQAMFYCWDIAEALAEDLANYAKYNGQPALHTWCDIVDHKPFADFIEALYLVTQGVVPNDLLPNDIIEYIKHSATGYYEDSIPYPYAVAHVDRCMEWFARKLPNNCQRNEIGLYYLCADIIKYAYIQTTNKDIIEIDSSYPEEILLRNPSIALICMCSSYVRGTPNNEFFCLDGFFNILEYSISPKLPGTLEDQLFALFYTQDDEEVRQGALQLLVNINKDLSLFIKLAESISQFKNNDERIKYARLLPPAEELNNSITISISKYKELLGKCRALK